MSAPHPFRESSSEPALEVHLLGMVDFDACLYLQERMSIEIGGRTDGQATLLVCEHPPLITIGREGSRSEIHCGPEELIARQMEVRWLNRGGGCFVHVPGQLALYPIVPIDRRGLGLTAFRQRLEQAVVDTCDEMRVEATRREETAGVWARGGQLAHVGLAVRSWVASQGVFVNVAPRMEFLRLVRARTGRVTSLSAERRVPTSMASVRESLIRRVAARLDYERFHIYTGHPLLRRTRRVVAYA